MNGLDALARTLPTLLVIVGALLLLRHWARRGGVTTDCGVRVVTRTGIAKGTVLAVVAVGERRMLVGASEHGVSLLAELDDQPELASAIAPAIASAAPAAPAHEPTAAVSGPDTAPTSAPARASLDLGAFGPALAGLHLRRPSPWRGLGAGRTRPTTTTTPDRPRMAPIDRLRDLTVRRPVPSHPRSSGVHRRT